MTHTLLVLSIFRPTQYSSSSTQIDRVVNAHSKQQANNNSCCAKAAAATTTEDGGGGSDPGPAGTAALRLQHCCTHSANIMAPRQIQLLAQRHAPLRSVPVFAHTTYIVHSTTHTLLFQAALGDYWPHLSNKGRQTLKQKRRNLETGSSFQLYALAKKTGN